MLPTAAKYKADHSHAHEGHAGRDAISRRVRRPDPRGLRRARAQCRAAAAAGVPPWHVLVDPGIGFADGIRTRAPPPRTSAPSSATSPRRRRRSPSARSSGVAQGFIGRAIGEPDPTRRQWGNGGGARGAGGAGVVRPRGGRDAAGGEDGGRDLPRGEGAAEREPVSGDSISDFDPTFPRSHLPRDPETRLRARPAQLLRSSAAPPPCSDGVRDGVARAGGRLVLKSLDENARMLVFEQRRQKDGYYRRRRPAHAGGAPLEAAAKRRGERIDAHLRIIHRKQERGGLLTRAGTATGSSAGRSPVAAAARPPGVSLLDARDATHQDALSLQGDLEAMGLSRCAATRASRAPQAAPRLPRAHRGRRQHDQAAERARSPRALRSRGHCCAWHMTSAPCRRRSAGGAGVRCSDGALYSAPRCGRCG